MGTQLLLGIALSKVRGKCNGCGSMLRSNGSSGSGLAFRRRSPPPPPPPPLTVETTSSESEDSGSDEEVARTAMTRSCPVSPSSFSGGYSRVETLKRQLWYNPFFKSCRQQRKDNALLTQLTTLIKSSPSQTRVVACQ